jgi:hydroxyethylthiazole kinase
VKKIKLDVYTLLKKIRDTKPVVHHLTNWVTIYDCANIIKVIGASPVMSHAKEEVAEMARLASSLVLNIGTLDREFIESMKIAAVSANQKGIPVVLDVCGAGATQFRDKKSFELLDEAGIDIIKGNVSEIARICGEDIRTRGVDAAEVVKDMIGLAKELARKRECIVVVTAKDDIVTDGSKTYVIKNGHPMMPSIVGTGCMAASIIGAFAAVEHDLVYASAAALVCFEVAAECAVKKSSGPGTFKEKLFDCIFHLDKKILDKMQKIEA